ncbi:alpha/beta fold hydrolase [Glycomyces sp. L485]|uniref:alpha/beta fold hydrolase n=1 Tax=Glycomyces sp. L485 TaxID=2909235 RepID=UPI001F4BC896|nr:alpha/beta fold hydrolase [Glycomyces sp. L485]MCH7229588.1 alpha/beta fold hydrolase [Glycomyces sp. L485]
MIPYHLVDGTGDPVVLINSLGGTLDMWKPQVGPLTERFRVVRFDTRGHGATHAEPGEWSMDDFADDVADLLVGLGIERAHLVGISLGGAIAMTTALRHPGRVGRLVLLSTAPKLGTVESWHERTAKVKAEGCGSIADATMNRWFTPGFHAEHPEVVAEFREHFAACDAEGYASCCDAIAKYDLRGRLSPIDTGALVMYGTLDEVTTASDAEAIASEIALTEVVEVEGAQHLISTEQADFVNRRIIDFLSV